MWGLNKQAFMRVLYGVLLGVLVIFTSLNAAEQWNLYVFSFGPINAVESEQDELESAANKHWVERCSNCENQLEAQNRNIPRRVISHWNSNPTKAPVNYRGPQQEGTVSTASHLTDDLQAELSTIDFAANIDSPGETFTISHNLTLKGNGYSLTGAILKIDGSVSQVTIENLQLDNLIISSMGTSNLTLQGGSVNNLTLNHDITLEIINCQVNQAIFNTASTVTGANLLEQAAVNSSAVQFDRFNRSRLAPGSTEQPQIVDELFELKIQINNPDAGEISSNNTTITEFPAIFELAELESLQLLAIPEEEFDFSGWYDAADLLVESAPTFPFIMGDTDYQLFANFDFATGSYRIAGAGVTDIDGNYYSTVIIDGVEWMAENLRTTRYQDGTWIIIGPSGTNWDNNTSGAGVIYPHDEVAGINSSAAMVDAYGKLYNWYAVDNQNGLCPVGWQVPSDQDWSDLETYITTNYSEILENNAANYLISCRQVDSPLGGDCDTTEHPRWDNDDGLSGLDEFGLSILPAGTRAAWSGGANTFTSLGHNTRFFSATEDSENLSLAWTRSFAGNRIHRARYNKAIGASVRCINQSPALQLTTAEATGYSSGLLEATVLGEGNSPVSERGFVWGTSSDPTLTSNSGMVARGSGTGKFSYEPTGLDASTVYYVRAYAINSSGTSYSHQLSFETDRDPTVPFSLELEIEPAGSGQVQGGGNYLAGETVQLTASPDTDFLFKAWLDSESDTVSLDSQFTYTMPATNSTLTAVFEAVPEMVLVNPVIWLGGDTVLGTGYHPANSTIELIAVPLPGYKFSQWSDGSGHLSYDTTYFFTVPEPPQSPFLRAEFEAITYSLTLQSEPAAVGTTSGAGDYPAGEQVTLTATPDTGYKFVNWTDPQQNIISTDSSFQYTTSDTDLTLTANFAPIQYVLTPTTDQKFGGTVSDTGSYIAGETVQLTAVPSDTYLFTNWTDETGTIISSEPQFNFTMPPSDFIIVANFKVKIYPGAGVTDIDGNSYSTVIIGEQEWMAENLRTTQSADGDGIPGGLTNQQWEETNDYAYAIYDHTDTRAEGIDSEAEMVEAYGKLYNWYAVDNLNLCPAGWSVPSDTDFQELLNFLEVKHDVDNQSTQSSSRSHLPRQGEALKSCRTVDSPLGGDCATDEHPRWDYFETPAGDQRYGIDMFGFAGLPAGWRKRTGIGEPHDFQMLGERALFWTRTKVDHTFRRIYQLRTGQFADTISRASDLDTTGASVRCLKD